LLALDNVARWRSDIVKQVAQHADRERVFNDALLLYNLAEEYDSVVRVLNTELGNSLARPTFATLAPATDSGDAVSLALTAEQNIVPHAEAILDYYRRQPNIWRRVSTKSAETCETLLQLKRGLRLYAEGKLREALAVRNNRRGSSDPERSRS
jgi:nuclear pore complex protein Nup93